jgi:hypothetical protein
MRQQKLTKLILPITFGVIFILLMIARIIYPNYVLPADAYNDWWDVISNLGDLEKNPIGFIFFQIAMAISGLIMIPTIIYVHPKLWKYSRLNTALGTIFMILGVIGFLLVGLIPNDTLDIEKFHEISAGVGFLGVAIACMFYFFAIKIRKIPVNLKLFNIMIIVWWTGILLTGIFFAIASLYYDPTYDLGWYNYEWGLAGVPVIFSFALWERVMYCIMFLALWAGVKMIPERTEDTKK